MNDDDESISSCTDDDGEISDNLPQKDVEI